MEECARMNCDKEAVALLTFAPQQAKAWLYDLLEANPTGGIMLCRKHANGTVVPMSWQLIDARDPAWPGPAAPATAEPMAAAPVATPAMTPDGVPLTDQAGRYTGVVPPVAADPRAALPSDAMHGRALSGFAGPVTPEPYAEPRAATLRAAGVLTEAAPRTDTDADLSLFQLPLADVPAVTPHPDHR